YEDKIAVHKRPAKGLLSSLWELPNSSREMPVPAALQEIGILEAEIFSMKNQKHIFTHIEWYMDCYYIKVSKKTSSELVWLTKTDAETSFALPSAFRKIWREGLSKMEN
ncbi:MAG: NUDIX domain-containing protein, partial [Anaerotignum sp.]|nr:NUDIX domain-containing protein [Anaerotignum sp.]